MKGRRSKYWDYSIRLKGSPEIPYDPMIVAQMNRAYQESGDAKRSAKRAKVYLFLVKTALEILPPQQRKMFYSAWVRSHGRLSKGIMEYSRKTKQNHYTAYNNYYKALASLKSHLKKTGHWDYLINYLRENEELDGMEGIE